MIRRVDLHAHTRFSHWKHLRIIKPRDSYNEPIDVFRRCRAAGMDFVAITDHDTIDGALDLLARYPVLEREVIVGEEVETYFPDTGQWVHVNVFDVTEPDHREMRRLRGNVHDLVGWLRGRGLFHVLNHPFQSYKAQKPAMDYVEEILDLFDHFEVANTTLSARHNRAVEEMIALAAGLYARKHGVGGSDAHNLTNLATTWTEVEVADDDPDPKRAFLAAAARGEARPVGRSIGALSLTANVYRIIGQYYASLADPVVRREMKAVNYLGAAILAPACVAGVPAAINLGNVLRLEAVTLYLRRELRRARSHPGLSAAAPAPAPGFREDPEA